MKKHHACIIGGIISLIATVVVACMTGKEECEPEEEEEAIFDMVLRKVNHYKFVILMTVITGVMFTLSVRHYALQAGAAITSYKILKREYDAYQQSAKKVLPPKKLDEVKSGAISSTMENEPIKNHIITSKGTTLLYEPVSRTLYEGSIGDVQVAEKTINDDFDEEESSKIFYSYRDFLDMIGLTNVHLDDPEVEKNIGFHKFDGPVTISYNVQILPDGERVVALVYNLAPRYDFDW